MGNVLFFTKIHNILQMLTLQLTIGCSFGLPSTNFVRQNMYLRTSGRKIVHPITAIVDAKRYWLIKYWLLHDCSGSKEAACSILWFILRIVISQGQVRSGQVRPARQIGEPFSGAGAKGIYSTWYLVQNKVRLFYVQQNLMKDLQC